MKDRNINRPLKENSTEGILNRAGVGGWVSASQHQQWVGHSSMGLVLASPPREICSRQHSTLSPVQDPGISITSAPLRGLVCCCLIISSILRSHISRWKARAGLGMQEDGVAGCFLWARRALFSMRALFTDSPSASWTPCPSRKAQTSVVSFSSPHLLGRSKYVLCCSVRSLTSTHKWQSSELCPWADNLCLILCKESNLILPNSTTIFLGSQGVMPPT